MERLTNFQGIPVECFECKLDDECDYWCKVYADCAEKLKEYENLEEQGLLLKLPCKVGDTVWDNDFGKPCSYYVTGFSFGDLNEDYCENEVAAFDQVIIYYTNANGSITGRFAVSEIGKTVFLTPAEAEEALRKTNETED